MGVAASLAALAQGAAAHGLSLRGAFHPETGDAVPALPDGSRAATLLLLGFVGGDGFAAFAAAPEASDGAAQPLDRWSRRVIDALGEAFGSQPLYPFGGPPYHPFQRWAQRCEPVHSSPLGILIHPVFGLWHSYRGALAFAERLELPPPQRAASPCESCREKPCLTACPVGAFTPAGYDVAACTAHLDAPEGATCLGGGCRARNACPVGAAYRYGAAQAAFHMRAFHQARSGRA